MAAERAPPPCLAVAYSGGRDSTALLHAVCRALKGSDVTVHALHVHHGLSALADTWLAQCQAQCRRWAKAGYPVRFHHEQVSVLCAEGESLEAQARAARYDALARMAHTLGCRLVLLAHHREDQAETVLLQALRGASVAGLAAMPREVEREGLLWLRPWLTQPRAAIDAYVRRHRLRHVEDDSNSDVRFARNRLRRALWPALVEAFPDAAQALADVAWQAQDALVSVEAVATTDLARLHRAGGLDVAALQALGTARCRQVLRLWLRGLLGRAAPRSLILRLASELPQSCTGRWPAPGGELRLYRGCLGWWPRGSVEPVEPGASQRDRVCEWLTVQGPGDYALPAWQGVLRVRPVASQGASPERLTQLALRPRAGGERFQRAPGTPPRALKRQFQAVAVPAWVRDGPLVYAGDQLLYVPGLGMDARCWAPDGSTQWGLQWCAGDAPVDR
jgi:tRNA(Ile)-lysidine synthase